MRISFRCAFCVVLLTAGLADLNAVPHPDQADPRQRSFVTLRRALREAKEWKKVHAAEALIWSGYPQGVKEIFTSELATAGPGYSIGVWRVLARLEPKGTPKYKIYLDKIRQVATGPDGDERIGALETLGKLGYAGRDPKTIEAAKGSTGLLPIVARWVLANSGKPEEEAHLAALLDMKEPLERGIVGYALRWLPKLRPSTLSKLKVTLEKEPEDSVGRVYLVAALYVHASQKEDQQWAKQELLKYIARGKGEEKYEAASVFGRWGERKDIPKLLPLLDDPDFDVQIGGAYAILTIQQKSSKRRLHGYGPVNGYNGIHQETGLFIYWGGKKGYGANRRWQGRRIGSTKLPQDARRFFARWVQRGN